MLAGLLLFCAAVPGSAAFTNFITREGDRLMDGDTPFRFMGVAAFDLHYRYNNLTAQWELPDPWEQEDGFRTLQHMGGTANRVYALAVRKNGESVSIIRHVEGPGVFNEAAFRALDRAVQLAGQYGVRLVISLIDGRSHWGGPRDYAAFRGKPESAFWTDAQIKADFKATIAHLLNRVNTQTGVRYRDDRTIFAWELGNEMTSGETASTYAWMSEMATYLKSLDAKHLVCSGHYVREQDIPAAYLADPNIDIIDAHYYSYHGYPSLRAKLEEHAAVTAGRRPMIVGEFGMDTTAAFTALMDGIMAHPHVAGGLMWNLRVHSVNGGYFRKDGQTIAGVFYRGYRWPGYPVSGDAWDEPGALAVVRARAFQIRGLAVPPVPVPVAPWLFVAPLAHQLTWRGATGAASYIVERANDPAGPWTEIATGVTDDRDAGEPLYTDPDLPQATSHYYRVKARNDTGTSEPSNVVGPVVRSVSR